jgi:hypothetical protein
MSDDEPEFGYGKGDRPLWTVRDRDAERIRDVLRRAGRKEFGVGGGFAVESGGGANPFLVACAGDPKQAAAELPQYEAALRKAGFRVEPEPEDDQTLQVWPPS